MEIKFDRKYKEIILESLAEYQYKVALELNEFKGHSMTKRRKELTQKQKLLEELQQELNSF
jgi:hypothetical protein